MAIFPVILYNTFLDNTNGSLWLQTIDTQKSLEDRILKQKRKYYPTFLNVLIKTSSNYRYSKDSDKNESEVKSRFKSEPYGRVLQYNIGENYFHDFIHYNKNTESVNFVYY